MPYPALPYRSLADHTLPYTAFPYPCPSSPFPFLTRGGRGGRALFLYEKISCLEETGDDLSQALPLFSRRRAPEAKDLVELSRGFDRTGIRGFFGFILPLILDSICHGAAPRVFAPNTIAMLQKEGMTFRRIRCRKALDRVMQAFLVGAAAAAVLVAARAAFARVLVPLAAAFLR